MAEQLGSQLEAMRGDEEAAAEQAARQRAQEAAAESGARQGEEENAQLRAALDEARAALATEKERHHHHHHTHHASSEAGNATEDLLRQATAAASAINGGGGGDGDAATAAAEAAWLAEVQTEVASAVRAQAMAEAELSELRSSLVTREEQLEAVKQARYLVITPSTGGSQAGGGDATPMCPGYHPTCIQAATLCVYPGCRSMRMQAAVMQGVT